MIATYIKEADSKTADFDYQLDYFESVREAHNFKSQWSLFEVTNLDAPHGLGNIVQIAYDKHWGHRTIFVEVLGDTWLDLYVAADKAIALSGDNHHVFIEAFNPTDVTGQVSLSTGS